MRASMTLFDVLTDDDVAWLQQACLRRVLKAGEVLVEYDREGGDLAILLDGECSVHAANGSSLGLLARGDVVGEVTFIDGRRTLARVTARTSLTVAALPRATLDARLAAEPEFAARFYLGVARVLAYRLRRNLQVSIGKDADVLDGRREYKDELDLAGLDGTARAGARLANLAEHLR